MTKILIIGAGSMGYTIAQLLIDSGKHITVVDPTPNSMLDMYGANMIDLYKSIEDVPSIPDIAIFAVKPDVLRKKAKAYTKFAKSGCLMISIAVGVSIKSLKKVWGKDAHIIRAMPNRAGTIRKGITGIYPDKNATQKQIDQAEILFGGLGKTIILDEEDQINSVAAISGSGPAYVYLFTQSLIESGKALGLSKELSEHLAWETVIGSAAVLAYDGALSLDSLQSKVATPGGTTESALKVLKSKKGLTSLMKTATKAAYDRAQEIENGK